MYIRAEFAKVGMEQALLEGMVLTGGGALLTGMWEMAERVYDLFSAERFKLAHFAAYDQLGQDRRGGDSRPATVGLHLRLDEAAAFDANRQADSIHADFVSHITRARGVFNLAHVARVCDMLGYLLAIHSYEFEI